MRSRSDIDFMSEALKLAAKGCGHTRPNPSVGAVIVKNGKIVGRGYHKRCGGDHAEVAAIKDAIRHHASRITRNATLYVTLEPCSKPGRVGACTDAIIEAGIARVVYGATDPNAKNRNKAKRLLAKAGIICERMPTDACEALILPFRKHVTTQLPFVTVKLAMSLDGKICDNRGDAKWVSSNKARRITGELRAHVDVVMVGAKTIRKDNPSLLCHQKHNDDLWRAVVSKSGKLPKNAQIFTDGAKDRTLVYRDAAEAVRDLGRRGFTHILCEGGLKLATSLAEAGLVDEWITVLAPKVIGTHSIGQATRIERTICLQD